MANGRAKPAEPEMSPCPLCETMMESPVYNLDTNKSTTTKCSKCGTQRTIMLPDTERVRTWN